MASHRTSAVLLLSLLLFAAANPSAHGAILQGLTVGGSLCCTSTGNCPGTGVVGANISLNCGILGTVGTAVTDATGLFNITVPAGSLPGIVLGLPIVPCVVAVRLPLGAAVCPVLSTATGVLSSALRSVGTVVTTVLGLVQSAVIIRFTQTV